MAKKNGTLHSIDNADGSTRLTAEALLQMKTLQSKRDKLARQLRVANGELELFLLKEFERCGFEFSGPVKIDENGVITPNPPQSGAAPSNGISQ